MMNDPLNDGLLMEGDGMVSADGRVVDKLGTPPLLVTTTALSAVAKPITVFAALLKRSWLIAVVGGYVAVLHVGADEEPDNKSWYCVLVPGRMASALEVEYGIPPFEAVREADVPPFDKLMVNDPLNDGLLMDGDGIVSADGRVVDKLGTPPLLVITTALLAVDNPVTVLAALLKRSWLIVVVGGYVAVLHAGAAEEPDSSSWYCVLVPGRMASAVEVEYGMPPFEAVSDAPVPPFVRPMMNDPLKDGLLMDGDGSVRPLGSVVTSCGTPPLVVVSTLESAVGSPATTLLELLYHIWLMVVEDGMVADPHVGAPDAPERRGWLAVAVPARMASALGPE
jgi:hypothetical protein